MTKVTQLTNGKHRTQTQDSGSNLFLLLLVTLRRILETFIGLEILMWYLNIWRTFWQYLSKASKLCLCFDPAFLGIYSKETIKELCQNICTRVLITALFTLEKNRN